MRQENHDLEACLGNKVSLKEILKKLSQNEIYLFLSNDLLNIITDITNIINILITTIITSSPSL